MSEVLAIENYIQPISKKNPVGTDLRADNSIQSLYYQIKDARNEARDLERQHAMGIAAEEKPRWDTVAQLCANALETQTKDLEVAAWLIEALIRREGFAGLATGFSLIKQLIQNYWETIYPLPDEAGLETRLAPLISLNGDDYEGTLIRPIYHLMITQGNTQGPFALWQYQQAIENSKITDKTLMDKRREQGSIFLDQVQIAVQESKPEFYSTLQNNLQQARISLDELNTVLEEKCGRSAPSKAKIVQALEHFSDHIRFILKDAPFTVTEESNNENQAAEELSATSTVDVEMSERIGRTNMAKELHTRNDALELLGCIAEFFRKTEPQSPLPYLLDRAQSLGRLSFPELLRELVSDDGARNAAYKLMGVASNDNG